MVIREIYEDILLEIFRSATIGIGGGRGQFLVAHYHLDLQANPKQNCPKNELIISIDGRIHFFLDSQWDLSRLRFKFEIEF